MASRSKQDTTEASSPESTFDPNTPQVGEEADEATLAAVRERDEANAAAASEESDPERVAARVGGRVGAIAITAEKNSLATKYGTDAPYGAIFTADPGTTGTATGEVTGGAPAYNRKAINWNTGSPTNGVITGSAVFDVPAGTTVTYAAVCSSVTPGAATLLDRIAITSQNFATQGTLTVNFTYTQS